ncbi:hypothetical protein [Chryseobacterium sp. SIMBA_028]
MKTSTSNNQYAESNNVRVILASMHLSYNIYQKIYYPEKSDLFYGLFW